MTLVPFVGSDPIVIDMLCKNGSSNTLPKGLDEWKRRAGENNQQDCLEKGTNNLSKLNLEQRFAIIEVTAISCDIRCILGDVGIEEVSSSEFLVRDVDNTIRDPDVLIEAVYIFGAAAVLLTIGNFWVPITHWLASIGLLRRKKKS